MNILIVAGGKSAEEKISVLTALRVYRSLTNGNKHIPILIYYHPTDECFYGGKGVLQLENYENKKGFKKIDFRKEDNKYFFVQGLKRVYFDIVLPLVHGENAEDGTMSSFFTILGYPVLASPISAAGLSQDKILFKDFLKGLKIKTPRAKHLTIREYQNNLLHIGSSIKDLKFPLIVKPYNLGSSIGISKVTTIKNLLLALKSTFELTDKVIIEEYLEDTTEVNIAVIQSKNGLIYSSIEKIIKSSENIYSFDEKYLQSQIKKEVPAIINSDLQEKIKNIAQKVYREMGLAGPARLDFLIQNNTLYLNEINAIPGNWSENIFAAAGINITDILDIFLQESIERINKNLNSNREKVTYREIAEAKKSKFD